MMNEHDDDDDTYYKNKNNIYVKAYILFKLNLGINVTRRVGARTGDTFAKLDNEGASDLINKFIPNYNIQYLNNFGENIKESDSSNS